MSELAGKFKAKTIKWETTTDETTPYMRVVFKLTEQWDEETSEWLTIESPVPGDEGITQFCGYTYWLQKQAKSPNAKCTPLEYSQDVFKKAWGFEMSKFETLDELNDATRDKEKIVILQADEDKYHNVKYVNNLGGKIKEGMLSLSHLLG